MGRGKLKELSFSRSGEQLLTIATREDCRALWDELNEAEIVFTIKRYSKRRSLDANAYAWVLMDKLANVMRIEKTEIYRSFIRDIGGNCETVCVLDSAVDKLRKGWEHNGLGWLTEVTPSKIEDCTNVILYYGSSTYDTAQMSRLINLIVDECKAHGIETMTPDEICKLKGLWDG